MRKIQAFWIFFIQFCQFVRSQDCIVSEFKTNLRKSCVFPFTVEDTKNGLKETFNTCTDIADNQGKLWCSTKVGRNMLAVKILTASNT